MSKIRLNSAAVGFICYLIHDFSTTFLPYSFQGNATNWKSSFYPLCSGQLKYQRRKCPFQFLLCVFKILWLASLISSLNCNSCVMDCSEEKLISNAIAQFLLGMLETLKEQQ